jgi:hydroxyethylthiazole kinase
MGPLDGNGSFRTYLLDALYNLTGDSLLAGARIDEPEA